LKKTGRWSGAFKPLWSKNLPPIKTVEIIKGLRDKYEVHHRVKIPDESIGVAVRLSSRYISDRFLPDKAIDVIDEACPAVACKRLLRRKASAARRLSLPPFLARRKRR